MYIFLVNVNLFAILDYLIHLYLKKLFNKKVLSLYFYKLTSKEIKLDLHKLI